MTPNREQEVEVKVTKRSVFLLGAAALVLVGGIASPGDGNECTSIPGVTCSGDRAERPGNTNSVVLAGHAKATFPDFIVSAEKIELVHAPGSNVLVMAEGGVSLQHAGQTLSFRNLSFEAAAPRPR
jgi:hypothetical protein